MSEPTAQLLNTLYVMSDGAYVRLDHDVLRVEIDGSPQLEVPLIHIGTLAVFGNTLVSPAVIARCADDGRAVVFFDRRGRYKARIQGGTRGNVLLRRAQHIAQSDPARVLAIATRVVAGKLQNSRSVLMRGARDSGGGVREEAMRAASRELGSLVRQLVGVDDINVARGLEGLGAKAYFGAFASLIRSDDATFTFEGRHRRPPRDAVNALLSFLYALLQNDCASAAEGVGLDPQVGYLHALRPGRAALALDLMEELRSVLADRLALSLINRCQLTPADFDNRTGGAVLLNERGRKTVVVAYQKRKKEETPHPVLGKSVPWGLIPHVQARLLARHLRGDIDSYVPFRSR